MAEQRFDPDRTVELINGLQFAIRLNDPDEAGQILGLITTEQGLEALGFATYRLAVLARTLVDQRGGSVNRWEGPTEAIAGALTALWEAAGSEDWEAAERLWQEGPLDLPMTRAIATATMLRTALDAAHAPG